MSENNRVLLIDLSKQFPFEIDDEKKKELCFSETLVISCTHGQGDIDDVSAESEWSCSKSSDERKEETKEYIPRITLPIPIIQDDENEAEEEEEYDDFHFYFFPDCKKPHKEDSTDSIVLEDGMPTINLNKRGVHCICNGEREDICKCGKKNLLIKCTCGPNDDICVCDPEIVEPTCPCDCACNTTAGDEHVCHSDDESFCGCPFTPKCSCDNLVEAKCACFPMPNTPGNAGICKCCEVCECVKPCVCDALPDPNECICSEVASHKVGEDSLSHLPPPEEPVKLKRKRAGKHGYRWCPDVDPKHTFFDYAYGRHDKIDYTLKEPEKVKIMGLGEKSVQGTNDREEVNDKQDLHFKKKSIRETSLDCCSAVGGITISVDVLGEDKNKFLIQVVSHSSKEGAKCGSKLVSIVDCKLHTLEENRSEHITRNDIKKQRRSYMTICDSGYYNKVTRICGPRNVVKRIYHSFDNARDFLLEGANIVLLRYFAIIRHKGYVNTHTVMINGTICENIYVCLGVSQAIVNGKPLFVEKVERHIIESSGLIHQTLTVMSLRGYIVSHEWADTDYIFHVNPLLRVTPETNEIEPHEPLRENWRSDLQLLSDYLDFKSARTSEGARYASDNGELTGVIHDYLQALLLLRPQDTLLFTREYFQSAISDLDLAHNDFFQPRHKSVRYYFYED